MNNTNAYNQLSLKEKADLFKLYVANGITSIDSIKEHYNKFADGGKKDTIPTAVNDYGNLIDTINPSVVTAKAPSIQTNKGRRAAANMAQRIYQGIDNTGTVPSSYRNYIQGELQGAIPMTKYLDKAGTDILNGVDNVTAWVPGPIGTANWLGHMGADALQGNWGKVGKDIALAAVLSKGTKLIDKGIKRLTPHIRNKYLSYKVASKLGQTINNTEFINSTLVEPTPVSAELPTRKIFSTAPRISDAELAGIPKGERNNIRTSKELPFTLVNRSNSYIPIENGNFIFESPNKAKKLATIHFTQNQPVTSHMGGNWDSMSTTLLTPYNKIRKEVAPINIEPMDTFFPNYDGVKFSTKGSKVLTGDKEIYKYYKDNGIDVEFSEEVETLLSEYRKAHEEYDNYLELNGYIPDLEARRLSDIVAEIGEKIQKIHYDFTRKNSLIPTIDDYRRLEKIEGLASGVNDSYLSSSLERELGFSYHNTPATHSNLEDTRVGDFYYEQLPEKQKEFVRWLESHKADYRKANGGYLYNPTIKPFSYQPVPVVRYATGGPKQSFRRWSKAITDYKGIDVKHDDTYDYRGFYNDNPDYAYSMLGENPEAHFPDTWKTPKHPTFSDESIYSNDKTLGGHWVELPNDKWEFQHSDFTYKHSDETNQYLRNEDPNSYATYQGGIVLDGASHGLKETKAKLFAPFYGKSFDEAFSKAKSKDKEFFRWKGNLYNTRLAPNNSSDSNMEESFDTLSDIVNRIKLYENSKDSLTGGYDKNKNVWYPHNSPEGGAKTIGYGIKLSNGSKWAKLAKSQGYLTDAQMEDAVSDLAQQHLDNSSRIFNKRFGEGAFEALDPRMQSILTDFDYNPGLSKFPKLMTAVYNNDIDSIYNEYKRYLGKKELGRNKGIKQELDTIFKK